MREITPPKVTSSDRFIDCQQAIEEAVQDIVAAAVKVGWNEPEALAAIIEIADNLALGLGADDEMKAILQRISRRPL